MDIISLLSFWGVPAAITGLLFWYLKKKADKREKERIERDNNQKELMLMIMKSSRANSVGIVALARAMQRIPDAKCNGDMEEALQKMSEANEEEKNFLLDLGIKQVF